MSTKDDILQRIDVLQAKIENMKTKGPENLTAPELKDIIDNVKLLKSDIDTLNNPITSFIGMMLETIPLKDFEEAYAEMTSTQQPAAPAAPKKEFANGKFDLFEPDFIATCQKYFEDLALNAPKKSKKYLIEAQQVMKGLPEDFKGLRAESAQEEEFIANLPGQTSLLTKIIDRQIVVKDKEAKKKAVTKTVKKAKP